jgi:hypothetical protein
MSMSKALVTIVVLACWGCGGTVRSEGDVGDDTTGPDTTIVDTAGDIAPDVAGDTVEDSTPDTAPHDTTPDPGPDTEAGGLVGDACTDAGDCTGVPGEGRLCLESIPMGPSFTLHFPGGYCSAECTDDGDFGEGGDCFRLMEGSLCFKMCDDVSDCRGGYVCDHFPGPGVTPTDYCLPPMW